MKNTRLAFFIFYYSILQTITAECPLEGYYHNTNKVDLDQCPGYALCPIGHFCEFPEKFSCAAGYYGNSTGISSPRCTDVCPAGYYCPAGTDNPIPCGSSSIYYCPAGSATPSIAASGYYTTDDGGDGSTRTTAAICDRGFYCIDGVKTQCPGGTVGIKTGLSTAACSAECPAGFYCPLESTDPYAHPCTSAETFCPAGSAYPLNVNIGYYGFRNSSFNPSHQPGNSIEIICEAGYYCPINRITQRASGIRLKCPGGTYGSETHQISSACSGTCEEGYYCPEGSTDARQVLCGANEFCPVGSAEPSAVKTGYFIIDGESERASQQIICPAGSYCVNSQQYFCPAGTYGDVQGLSDSSCSGKCNAGHYCNAGSTSSTQHECADANAYCPAGTSEPIPVTKAVCPPGSYCKDGIKSICPKSTFGDSYGLFNESCSGDCLGGYYCPAGSTSATEHECGSSRYYCPPKSFAPTPVDNGYCTIMANHDNEASTTTTTFQFIAPKGYYAWKGECFKCPAGSYGDSEGLSSGSCTGKCEAGYYCPAGSVSATQEECGGEDRYCPRGGNSIPLAVSTGFYTSTFEDGCPPGQYRVTKTTVDFTTFSDYSPIQVDYGDYMLSYNSCTKCPEGTFKTIDGDSISLCLSCPPLTSTSSSDRKTCDCNRLPGGELYNASTHSLYFDGSKCVAALHTYHNFVMELEQTAVTRTTKRYQHQCEPGYYCIDGIRYPCPAGSFGSNFRETSATCSGLCLPGFYCPLGSTSATEHACGGPHVYCPAGSPVPVPVATGYYSSRSSSSGSQEFNLMTIGDTQLECEEGHYCIFGTRYECPAGRYGSRTGETSPYCTGSCKRGHYCPLGSVSETQNECGVGQLDIYGNTILTDASVYCPSGSEGPLEVSKGYYTLGISTDTSDRTRFYQLKCEVGYYCSGGYRYQCPDGYYGDSEGKEQCTTICDAGYVCKTEPEKPCTSSQHQECGSDSVYCPAGSSVGIPVRKGYYSTGGQGSTTRTEETICEAGYYCQDGMRYLCEMGRYGDSEGLGLSKCSGWCAAGYYCEPGSTSSTQKECPYGTYSKAGANACMECPNINLDGFSPRCKDSRDCCFG